MWRTCVLAIFLLSPASGLAQSRYELTPFIGVRTGGGFRAIEQELALNVDSSLGFGLAFDFNLTKSTQIGLLWSRQDSSLEVNAVAPVPGDEATSPAEAPPVFDVVADYLHGNFVYGGGAKAFQPYVALGAGVALFDPDVSGASRISRVSFSIGTGFKSFFSERLGVRFDARAFGTRIGDEREDLACGAFGCVSFESAATFWQGQLVAGLVVSF